MINLHPDIRDAEPAPGVVRRALLSVFDKTGLVDLAKGLAALGVELVASGGTARALTDAGLSVVSVDDYTKSPEVLGGRVKTLHPRIHAGLLADRRIADHRADLEREGFGLIDLVVCNLYPFEAALAKGASFPEQIENIDIGGPTLVRAAAKNCDGGVTVLASPANYARALEELQQTKCISPATRRALAAHAFRLIAAYDVAIATWMDSLQGDSALPAFAGPFERAEVLRYGENPHQRAALYLAPGEPHGVARGTQLGGKALSYNNYLDLDAAYRAAYGLPGVGCAIVKHTNPCGLATAPTQQLAFERALAGDPVSAFGGIIGFNRQVSGDTAEAVVASKLFVECIAAPAFSAQAIELLSKKAALRLVQVPEGNPAPSWHGHRIGGGLLVQEVDAGLLDSSTWRCVTKRQPMTEWIEELTFAMHAVGTLKSNAIVVTKAGALRGAGAGQMSRVDATRQALEKAGEHAKGACLASDAFFPFDDSVRLAAAAGVVAIVQPGGSKRDDEVIAACDELGLCMLLCDRRHFRH